MTVRIKSTKDRLPIFCSDDTWVHMWVGPYTQTPMDVPNMDRYRNDPVFDTRRRDSRSTWFHRILPTSLNVWVVTVYSHGQEGVRMVANGTFYKSKRGQPNHTLP